MAHPRYIKICFNIRTRIKNPANQIPKRTKIKHFPLKKNKL